MLRYAIDMILLIIAFFFAYFATPLFSYILLLRCLPAIITLLRCRLYADYGRCRFRRHAADADYAITL